MAGKTVVLAASSMFKELPGRSEDFEFPAGFFSYFEIFSLFLKDWVVCLRITIRKWFAWTLPDSDKNINQR
jgi:hypothetical protein